MLMMILPSIFLFLTNEDTIIYFLVFVVDIAWLVRWKLCQNCTKLPQKAIAKKTGMLILMEIYSTTA